MAEVPGLRVPSLTLEAAAVVVLRCAERLLASTSEVACLCPAPLDALGCVAARDVVAAEPLPPFRASVVDGFAVAAADTAAAAEGRDCVLCVVGSVPAGSAERTSFSVGAGTAARIATGAPVPDGADAVVMVEDTAASGGGDGTVVRVLAAVHPGENIRPVGSDIARGEVVLRRGERVGAAEVGLLSAVGAREVRVFAAPRVGVLSTGDELVRTHGTAAPTPEAWLPGQVFDSNGPMLLAAVRETFPHGAPPPVDLGLVRDDSAADLADAIRGALFGAGGCDVVVTSGGVSVGERDHVHAALALLGADVHFGRVVVKPGKPLTFATIPAPGGGGEKLFFGLPGNPAAALTTFHLFCAPALRVLSGVPCACATPVSAALRVPARHADAFVGIAGHGGRDARPELRRARTVPSELVLAATTGPQQSSRLLSMRGANTFVRIPAGGGGGCGGGTGDGAADVVLDAFYLPSPGGW